MGRAHLIFLDGPEHVMLLFGPDFVRVTEISDALLGYERQLGCKGFVKPEVVPPFHGDQITKPHVGQLVQICVLKLDFLRKSYFLSSKKINFIVRDAPNILHSSK